MAGLEVVGVISIVPFLAIISNPDLETAHPVLKIIYDYLGMSNVHEFIVVLGLASVFLVISSSVFKAYTLHLLHRFSQLQRHYTSAQLLSAYLRQPYSFFIERNTAELLKTILSEVDYLVTNILQPAILLLAQASVVIAMGILLFVYDPMIATIVILAIGGMYGIVYLIVRPILSRTGNERKKANVDRFIACNEVLGGIKEIKVSGGVDTYIRRFESPSRRFSRHLATNETLSQAPLYLVEALGYTGLIIFTLWLMSGADTFSDILPVLGLYGFAAYRMLPSAQIIYRCLAKMRFGTTILETIHSEIKLTPHEYVETTPCTDNRTALTKSLQLNNIYYSYPSRPGQPALRDINLEIPANTITGIIGPTGSGKSTLIDLILGLLTPQKGVVLIDDTPLESIHLSAWQKQIGYVPQDIYLTDGTVAENIAFGIPPGAVDLDQVIHCAKAAELHYFIANQLPHGYETIIGERGIKISGGQKQRIGIARALYRNPSILLLDEATSALDIATERMVQHSISSLKGDKTIIMIAHRLSTMKICDHIIVMDSGSIMLEGSYSEIIPRIEDDFPNSNENTTQATDDA